jgi:hypothetical protein
MDICEYLLQMIGQGEPVSLPMLDYNKLSVRLCFVPGQYEGKNKIKRNNTLAAKSNTM